MTTQRLASEKKEEREASTKTDVRPRPPVITRKGGVRRPKR